MTLGPSILCIALGFAMGLLAGVYLCARFMDRKR